MAIKTSEKLLTVDEAAERLGLRVSTIRRKILERKITYAKVGRSVRIPTEVVDALISDGWREEIKG